jgi:hypothetical protein
MQFARKDTAAAQDTARKIGKQRERRREREGGGKVGHPGVPHFPISSLCVTSEYHFSFFPRGIKAVAENRGPPPRRDDLVIGWAEVSFSAPDIGNAR